MESVRAIAVSTGGSRALEMFLASDRRHVFPRHIEGRRRGAALLAKDIDLVHSVMGAREVELPPDLAAMVEHGLRTAIDSGVLDDSDP
jgi:hypothetical protein